MHNSLFIRDILLEANNDPLRRGFRDPHRLVSRDPDATVQEGDIELTGTWSISAELDAGADTAVRQDISDFLDRMSLEKSGRGGTIRLDVEDTLGARDFMVAVTDDCIEIKGGAVSGIWAGIAWVERQMRLRRGPFMPRGEIKRKAAWDLQISQGPWGGNASVPDFSPEYLDDDAFRLYAHYGVNSMMMYGDLLCYVKSDIFPELNFPEYDRNIEMLRDALQRAAAYGVTFTYVPVGPKLKPDHPVFKAHSDARGAVGRHDPTLHFLCSSNRKVLDFYEETFRNLFSAAPELAGTIMITFSESFYHCRMWENRGLEPCPVCAKRDVHQVVAGMVDAVERGVKSGNPNAFTAEWIYTWSHGDRREAFKTRSPGVSVFQHVEKDAMYRKNGYTKHVWDYSIDYTGPVEQAVTLSEFAHDSGRNLFVKTETGIGLEVFQFPYVPAMDHLAAKWQVVRGLEPFGVHQSWFFFGMFGSRAEELGYWTLYEGDMEGDVMLGQMAARDFGSMAAPFVIEAWRHMSVAVRHIPCVCLCMYYTGPSFLGPAHPLVPEKDAVIPDVFHGALFYLMESEETFSHRSIDHARRCLVMSEVPDSARGLNVVFDDPDSDGWDIMIDEYALAAANAGRALKCLHAAAGYEKIESDARRLEEEMLLTELIYRTFLTCENTLRFLVARRKLEKGEGDANMQVMKEVAHREKENALAAIPVYEKAPWLDLSMRLDGRFNSCVDMIRAKVEWIDRFLA